ncbi:unnamed protein product [Durusdinium trenchii]
MASGILRISGNSAHSGHELLHDLPGSLTVPKGKSSSPESSLSLRSRSHSPSTSPRGVKSGLLHFRASLVESQRSILRQLDQKIQELEKVPRTYEEDVHSKILQVPFSPSATLGPAGPKDEPRVLDAKSDAMTKVPSMPLPAIGSEEEESDEELAPGQKPQIKRQVTDTFTALNGVDEKRKKNVVWIQKNARVSLIDETYESHAPGVASLSRQSKHVAAKEARRRFENSGVFATLTVEHAEQVVAESAFIGYGSDIDVITETPTTCERIVRHRWFERAAMLLTLSNVIYISIDVEFNYSGIVTRASPGFIVIDNMFCVLFLSELLIRFLAFRSCLVSLRDPAFLFDLILVSMMMLESWVMPLIDLISGDGSDLAETSSILRIARVMRILRTARIAKLVRYVPELVILLKGMMSACRSVFFTLVLLVLVTYVFSITITEVSRGTSLETDLFPGMGGTILTLIVQCVMPDLEAKFKDAAAENWFIGVLWLTFIMFGTYIMMGLLVGILVETVKTVATFERKQLDVDFAKNVLWEMITEGCADQDGDNRISEIEFARLLARPEATRALAILGVDITAALDYGHLLFEDGEPLTFAEFMEGMMTLRGSNQTTVKDMVDLRKFTAEEFSSLHKVLLDICTFLASQGMPSSTLHRVSSSVRYSRASRMTQHASAKPQWLEPPGPDGHRQTFADRPTFAKKLSD